MNQLTQSLKHLEQTILEQQPKGLKDIYTLIDINQEELLNVQSKLNNPNIDYTEQYILQQLHLTIANDIKLYQSMISI